MTSVPKPIIDPKIPEGHPSEKNSLGSVSHLADTVSHNHAHAERHLLHALDAIRDEELPVVSWNIEHSEKHFAECAEHAAKLSSHIKKHPEIMKVSDEEGLQRISELCDEVNKHYVDGQKEVLTASKHVSATNNSGVEEHLSNSHNHLMTARGITAKIISLVNMGPGYDREMDKLQDAYPGRGMGLDPDSEEYDYGLDYTEAGGGNAIVGIPTSGVSGPKPSATGDSQPSGRMPASSGPANPRGNPGGNTPGPRDPGPPKVGGAPPSSKFSGNKPIPEISVEPVKHPDDHKHDKTCPATGDQVITAEACLEHFARVMMELAEEQEDPVWTESHRTLAEMWMNAAQMLLQYRIDAQANAGEVELKQQQIYQQDELHQQTLSQNDQLHSQTLQHNDQQHKQGMQQKDQQHKVGLQQQDAQHKFKMDAAATANKQKMSTQQQGDKIALQKKAQAAKPSPTAKKTP